MKAEWQGVNQVKICRRNISGRGKKIREIIRPEQVWPVEGTIRRH